MASKGSKKKKFDIKSFLKKNSNYIGILCGVFVFILLISLLFRGGGVVLPDYVLKYTFDRDALIPFKEGDLYGYMDRNGKVVIKPTYQSALEFHGKYAVVNKDSNYYIINRNGKVMVTEKQGAINYNGDSDFYLAFSSRLYNSNLKVISPKDARISAISNGYYKWVSNDLKKAGIITASGKKVYNVSLQKDGIFYVNMGDIDKNLGETYCSTMVGDGNYFIINCNTGKVIKSYPKNSVSALGNNLFKIIGKTDKDDSYVFIKNNRIVFDVKNVSDVRYFSFGYIRYKENDKYSYFDINKKKIYKEAPYDFLYYENASIWERNTSYHKFIVGRRVGLLKDDKVIIPGIYNSLVSLPEDLYDYLFQNGKNYILASDGTNSYLMDIDSQKKIHTFKTSSDVQMFAYSTFMYYKESDGKYSIYNVLTNKEKSLKADSITVFGNYIVIKNGKKNVYYNDEFKKIYEVKE